MVEISMAGQLCKTCFSPVSPSLLFKHISTDTREMFARHGTRKREQVIKLGEHGGNSKTSGQPSFTGCFLNCGTESHNIDHVAISMSFVVQQGDKKERNEDKGEDQAAMTSAFSIHTKYIGSLREALYSGALLKDAGRGRLFVFSVDVPFEGRTAVV